jgi:hypothetical protein
VGHLNRNRWAITVGIRTRMRARTRSQALWLSSLIDISLRRIYNRLGIALVLMESRPWISGPVPHGPGKHPQMRHPLWPRFGDARVKHRLTAVDLLGQPPGEFRQICDPAVILRLHSAREIADFEFKNGRGPGI